jgi:CubicO group peptidase (beta-lactamase class C family)
MPSSSRIPREQAQRRNYKLGGLSLILAISTCFQPAKAELPAGFDEFVNNAMKQYNTPGASVAVVEGDKVYLRGYGKRSVDKPGAVDADTMFMLASNTKPFTAALVAIMVDQHKIGWNYHVIDYMPELVLHDRYATRMCTPKDLLAHRTGLV